MNRPPPKAKLEVLLVEDSIEEVYLVRGLLDKTGLFQVTTSQDGDQAARLIKEHEFQLVITDLNLPGKDGYELSRLVKETSPDVPVIATTGYTAPHYHEQAYRTGADDLAVKPLDRDDFLKKVLAAVGMEAELAPRTSVVLAIGALPGDVESGCGGTLLWDTGIKAMACSFSPSAHPPGMEIRAPRHRIVPLR